MIIYDKNGNKIIVKIIIEIDNVPDNVKMNETIGNALKVLGEKVINGKIKIYEGVS